MECLLPGAREAAHAHAAALAAEVARQCVRMLAAKRAPGGVARGAPAVAAVVSGARTGALRSLLGAEGVRSAVRSRWARARAR
jgi:hypothetical protein